MVLVGGLVAWLADNLGRRLGKRRLHLWGLRPRHFATLATVTAGLLIPLATVTTVALLSSDVRTWITEGRRAITEAQVLYQEVKENEKALAQTNQKLKESGTKLSEAESRISSKNSQIATLEQRSKNLGSRISDLTARSAQLSSKLAVASRKVMEASQRYNRIKNDLNATEDQKRAAERLFRTALKQRDDAYQDFMNVERERNRLQTDVDALRTQIASLSTAEQAFKTRQAELQQELEARQKELNEVKRQLGEAEGELQELLQSKNLLTAMNDVSRNRPMVFSDGEEVARLVVPADMSISQARIQLNTLLRSARVAAELAGAKGTSRVPAAAIMDTEQESAEVQMSKIVARMAGVAEPRLLVAKSYWNSYQGEPVPLEIIAYPNRLAFKEGDVIAEIRIGSELPTDAVIRTLGEWLSGPVRDAAIKAGIVPAAGRAASIAEVTPIQIFDIVTEIKSLSRSVRVQALATSETMSAGPLRITFRLR